MSDQDKTKDVKDVKPKPEKKVKLTKGSVTIFRTETEAKAKVKQGWRLA